MGQLRGSPLFDDVRLKLYLEFQNNSNDSSSGAHNGTDTNITYAETDPLFGKYASFNGVSSSINIPTSVDFAPPEYTISWWSKILSADYASTLAVLGKDKSTPAGRQFMFAVQNGEAYAEHAGGFGGLIQATSAVPNDEKWHNFIIVFAAGAWSAMYQDGVSVGMSVALPPAALVNESGIDLKVGQREFPSAESFFKGNLDEISWFTGALTAAEASQIASKPPGAQIY